MTVKILTGNCLDLLRAMPDESVHCTVTSPPYWGLRSYDIPPTVWDGDPGCEHDWGAEIKRHKGGPHGNGVMLEGGRSVVEAQAAVKDVPSGAFCTRCGAWRGQLGLEPTPALYIEHMVEVFREVRRVLRRDGTLWLNMGDCYATGAGKVGEHPGGGAQGARWTGRDDRKGRGTPIKAGGKRRQDGKYLGPKTQPNRMPQEGLKPKDLVMMPARLALALQADGWWIRKEIIWHKPNPMPESTTDRPTSAHEKIHLCARSERYFYDAAAVREPFSDERQGRDYKTPDGWDTSKGEGGHGSFHRAGREKGQKGYRPKSERNRGGRTDGFTKPNAIDPSANGGRNLRDVWTIATAPFPEAHFACVDAETEALTPNGWRRHDQLSDGAEIAAFVPELGCLVWQPATFHRYPFSGELVRIEKRDNSQRLTKNHRCLVRRRKGGIAVVEACDLRPSMEIPTVAPLEVERSKGPGEVFAALLGWYLAEGERKRHRQVRIHQSLSANPEKVETIRSLLRDLRANFSERTRTREWRGRPSVEITFSVGGDVAERLAAASPEKMIDLSWLRWPAADIRALLDAIIDGDGHRRKDGRTCIIAKSREFIDAAQILALRLGWRGHIGKRGEGTFALHLTEGQWLTLRDTNGQHTPIGREAYEGIVWCPSVASTFWLARRSGRTFITGNTFPPALVEPCIKAGTSEKGCCPGCGAPWQRVLGEAVPTGGRNSGNKQRKFREEHGGNPESLSHLGFGFPWEPTERPTVGWEPSCACGLEAQPCTVLDPFGGAGTVGLVADRLGRDAILLELGEGYVDMARRRIAGDAPLFSEVEGG